MRPENAARALARIGEFLLAVLLLLRVLSLSQTIESPRLQITTEAETITDQFLISEDGKQAIFWQGLDPPAAADRFKVTPTWFRMNIDGGQILPTEKPEDDIRPFELRDEQLFLIVGDGFSLTTGSLPDTRVKTTALAPDRGAMAFYADQEGGPGGVYVLFTTGKLNWLGEESGATELSWSPDSQQIAYIAQRDGIDQVLTIDRDGKRLRQVSSDPGRKKNPIWLADSQTIAYISQDPPTIDISASEQNTGSIYLAKPGGAAPVVLSSGLSQTSRLIAVNGSNAIAFSKPIAKDSRSEELWILNPETLAVRRIYPPFSIDNFSCPVKIAGGSEDSLNFKLSNTSLRPASVPTILRIGDEPIALLDERDKGAARIEGIDLAPEETRQVEWQIQSTKQLRTYVSLIINQGEVFPMAEAQCVINNTYLGLPNLMYLQYTISLAAGGTLLLIPWLRHQKKRLFWGLFVTSLAIISMLIAVEAILVNANPG